MEKISKHGLKVHQSNTPGKPHIRKSMTHTKGFVADDGDSFVASGSTPLEVIQKLKLYTEAF